MSRQSLAATRDPNHGGTAPGVRLNFDSVEEPPGEPSLLLSSLKARALMVLNRTLHAWSAHALEANERPEIQTLDEFRSDQVPCPHPQANPRLVQVHNSPKRFDQGELFVTANFLALIWSFIYHIYINKK